MIIVKRSGNTEEFNMSKMHQFITNMVHMEPKLYSIDVPKVVKKLQTGLSDNMSADEMLSYTSDFCAGMGTESYDYSLLAGRISTISLYNQTPSTFSEAMNKIKHLLDDDFLKKVNDSNDYDAHIIDNNDFQYDILGIKTLMRSYLLKDNNQFIERPQYMLMRVAIFLCDEPDEIIETYQLMSNGMYTHASPTLFHAGMKQHQLASCFLMTLKDDSIEGIYESLKDTALISKSAGGIGISVSNIRAKGAPINGTNGTSNGLVPMLRVFNNTARYCDQCVVPNTIIYTTNGPCEIQYLANGDSIIHADKDEPISNVLEHAYNGPMLTIKTLHSVEPLKITPEHPLFALKDLGIGYNYKKTKAAIEAGVNVPEWIDAKDIRARDFVGFPIPNYQKDQLDISSDDCYFYGLLLGDGTLMQDKSYGKITIHTVAKAYIKEWLVQYFHSKCIQYNVDVEGNTTRVRWNKSTLLPIKYGDVYDRSKEKHVHHKWLHLPLDKCKYILKGLIDTDGSKGKELMFDSTSRNLIESVRYICLRMGVLTSGYTRDRRGQSHITSTGKMITNKKISYVLRIPKVEQICDLVGITQGSFTKYFQHDNILYTRVQSIDHQEYDGTLYDLQMSQDHSYITHNGLIHNGGGKRKGSFAIFIEPWHADIFDVLSLKLNHGLEEERARDLFYSLFIPDLFMECVKKDEDWYLFCPHDVPQLQEAYGESFNRIYTLAVKTNQYKRKVKARELWSKIIATQIETGTPYLVYKDACNVKSNQRHLGTIKSSNLCAEIVEYSAPDETAVCTLASLALPSFVTMDGFDFDNLVQTAMAVTRNLNHVVDKTSYPIPAAENSNKRHRPLGLGVQGLADVFQMLGIPYDSAEALQLNNDIFEAIYYGATKMSIQLAMIHGPYESFKGSPTSHGQFNFDLWNHTPTSRWNWSDLRQQMKEHGMRNSLLVALMPTASSASILGNTESFEPRTSNLYVRRVLSGEFMIMNKYLERACKKRNLWTKKLRNDLIKNKGSVQNLDLPRDLKKVFKTVWEMSQKALIDLSRGRAPYVCQSQSLNLYQSTPTQNSLNSMHFYAWKQGLKTGQYYLRTQPKASAIAFTVDNKVAEEVGYKRPRSGYTIYSKSQCNYCDKLKEKMPDAYIINCDEYLEEVDEFLDFIGTLTDKNPTTFPMVFHDGQFIGGYKEASNHDSGECISCSA